MSACNGKDLIDNQLTKTFEKVFPRGQKNNVTIRVYNSKRQVMVQGAQKMNDRKSAALYYTHEITIPYTEKIIKKSKKGN